MIFEKYDIADLVNLKCEERNHYNSNCLLCSAAGCFAFPVMNTKRQEHVKMQSVGHSPVYLFNSKINYVSKEHNIIHYCTCKPTFSYVMPMVQSWKECGPFMDQYAMN